MITLTGWAAVAWYFFVAAASIKVLALIVVPEKRSYALIDLVIYAFFAITGYFVV